MRPKILLHNDASVFAGQIFLCIHPGGIATNAKVINEYFKIRSRQPPLTPGAEGLLFAQLGKFFMLSIARKSEPMMILVNHQLVTLEEFETYIISIEGTMVIIHELLKAFNAAQLNFHHFIDDFEVSEVASQNLNC
ncbi:hypothetical protein [Mucilaginibacter endophyticus]|uniref:hypothetical protein n=1 Tax=Mucilaginibacter endophyticus TaxID=2675003 RepID=UPI000E0DA821|nr:hypothetical protein [Mucilaginibacter endophyticus]